MGIPAAEVVRRLAAVVLTAGALLLAGCGDEAPAGSAPAAGAFSADPAGLGGASLSNPAEVLHVVDGDTVFVRLEGEKLKVRLVGVDAPELAREGRPADPYGEASRDHLRGLLDGRSVRLEYEPAQGRLDRHGRTLAYLHREPDGLLVNREIIGRGYGRAFLRFEYARKDDFLAAEREARAEGRGLWSRAAPAVARGSGGARLTPREAADHAGEEATVCGRVAGTYWARSVGGEPTFLDFEAPHPGQSFKVVIWGRHRPRFGDAETIYRGKRVCATGEIRMHRGKPQIVARDPSQLQLQE